MICIYNIVLYKETRETKTDILYIKILNYTKSVYQCNLY